MIPKIIHYCWLSNDPYPQKIVECMESWHKYMPDYTIKRWSTQNFDINSVTLTQQAFNAKKWAFAADYIRAYALYTEGGIYLDSDVMLYGDLSKLLDSDFVSAVEHHPSEKDMIKNKSLLDSNFNRKTDKVKVLGIGIQAAVLASNKGHSLAKKVLDFYNDFTLEEILTNNYTAPTVWAYNAESLGYRYIDEEQLLSESVHLYPTEIISSSNQGSSKSIAIHWCEGSWLGGAKKLKKRIGKYKAYIVARDLLKVFMKKIKKRKEKDSYQR